MLRSRMIGVLRLCVSGLGTSAGRNINCKILIYFYNIIILYRANGLPISSRQDIDRTQRPKG